MESININKEDIEELEIEETIYDRVEGLNAEIAQMERMIEENIRKIEEGNDIEGRTFLKKHLEYEVLKKKNEVELLNNQI